MEVGKSLYQNAKGPGDQSAALIEGVQERLIRAVADEEESEAVRISEVVGTMKKQFSPSAIRTSTRRRWT